MKTDILLQSWQVAQTTHLAMGTVMIHKVFGPNAEAGLSAACSQIERIEGLLSRFLPDSDISRVNRSAGIASEPVSPETFDVLSDAVELSRRCDGCFDATIGPLVSLWSIGRDSLTPPDAAGIRSALTLVNSQDLVLNSRHMTAGLRIQGQSVDLGGIGKGFAGDEIRTVFGKLGISSAYSNLGGNVVIVGAKPDGSPWRIGIQHPRQEGRLIGSVSVIDRSVVTSGDYQRYTIDDQGKKRHHILDPRTGYPSESGLIGVTIVSDSSQTADALSTAVFVAGKEKGLELLRRFPKTDAILVDFALNVYITQGLMDNFEADRGVETTILN